MLQLEVYHLILWESTPTPDQALQRLNRFPKKSYSPKILILCARNSYYAVVLWKAKCLVGVGVKSGCPQGERNKQLLL